MDANTRFLIERMDTMQKDLREDFDTKLAGVEQRLATKIDVLWAFRLKILGASVLASGLGSIALTALIEYMKRKA